MSRLLQICKKGTNLYIKPVFKDSNRNILNKNKALIGYPIRYTKKEKITSLLFFADKNCKQSLSVGTIGQTIYARVLTRNLNETNLYLGIGRKLDAFNIPNSLLFIGNEPIKDDGSAIFKIVTQKEWQNTSKGDYLAFAMETGKKTVDAYALLELFETKNTKKQLVINQNISFLSLSDKPNNSVAQNRTITYVNQVDNNNNEECV